MRNAALFLVAFLSCALARAATIEHAVVSTLDGEREFWIALPARPVQGPHALVILLHGHGGNAEQILSTGRTISPLSMWIPIVDREQIVAVALQGKPDDRGQRGWNDCRRDALTNPQVDDVGFVRAVIADVERRGLLDRTRIYAMGMSNGAMMVLRLAQELDPPLAGFAAVAGSMARDSLCLAPLHQVSALFIAGTADPLLPYEGGEVRLLGRPRGTVVPVEASVAFWRQHDGLAADAVSAEVPHVADGSGTTRIERLVYGKAGPGPQVELLRVVGGGHAEPSLARHYGLLYSALAGPQNHDIESAEEAWRFFTAHAPTP